MKWVALSEIAKIRLGISLRGDEVDDPGGPVAVVQARDLTDRGRIASVLQRSDRASAQKGRPLEYRDVLIQSRGINYRVAIAVGLEPATVAASPLYVISSDELEPSYLAFLLRGSRIQSTLRRQARGTHVPQFSRKALEELRIPVPSRPMQLRYAEAAELLEQMRQQQAALNSARLSLLHARLESA